MTINFHVAEGIPEAYDLFINLPDEVHLLCPKTSEDDDEDYEDLKEPGEIGVEEKERRVQDFKKRVGIAYQTSLIFGFEEENAALQLQEFRTRTNSFLTTCSQCVRTWHRNRKPFLKQLAEQHEESTVAEMGRRLDRFDAARITTGLEGAKEFIEARNGIAEQKTFIEEDRSDLLVALYESLCCIAYLKQPENRVHFNYVFAAVQQRRTLKLAEILPTMTRFLFDDDKIRLTFARVSWSKLSELTLDDFEWAIKESLEDAMQKLNAPGMSWAQVQRFWEGVASILQALSSSDFVASLNSLSVSPSIYQIMLNHMATDSEPTLAAILKVFNIALQRGPKGIWGAFGGYSPVSVAEPVFASPAFKRLLTQTPEYSITMPEDKYLKGPVAIAWVKPFIESIKTSQKSDACASFSQHLVDDVSRDESIPPEGRLACFRGFGEALLATLESFLDPTFNLTPGQPSFYTNRVINLALKHKDIIMILVKMDKRDVAMSRTGLAVIAAVLKLDTSVTAVEYIAHIDKTNVQREVLKKSPELWGAFLDLLVPGATELARAVLMALLPLVPVEALRPLKKDRLSQAQEEFNATLRKVAAAIGKVFDKLEEFSLADLHHLLDTEVMEPVVAALLHGEPAIHQGGLSLIKAITNESSRGDAVLELTKSHFSTLLTSFTKVLQDQEPVREGHQKVIRLWTPQQNILRYSKDILDALCDPRDGLLRSKDLNNAERSNLKKWWAMAWTTIERAFNGLEDWSRSVETEVMKQFCRDTMELAEKFLEQDGLIAAALGPQTISESMLDPTGNSKDAMQEILRSPKEKCMGLTQMLRLKDQWLIQITVNVLSKLLRRLLEYEIEIPVKVKDYVQRTCIKNGLGKYDVATNLNNQQRAELLRTLGEDDDDIQILEVKPVIAEAPKKQSKLDQWSKSGDSSSRSQSPAVRSSKDDVRDLTPSVDKNRSILEQFRAKHAVKPSVKPAASKTVTPRLDAAKIKEARLKEQEAKKKRDAEVIARAKALRTPKPLVSGEGSGLQGLSGVQGKDHAPRSEMMVDSSSEDDDDSEDEAAFRAQTQAGKKRTDDTSSRIMQLKAPRGPVKKMKILRSAKDMRARLTPPMDALHQALLEWDIFHEGNDPPNGIRCSRVSTSYNDPRQYKDTFLPLLIYEAWRSFVTDKDENTNKTFGIKVATRMHVDKFIDVTTTMPFTPGAKDEFVSEGDIVLLSTNSQPLQGRSDPHCLSRISRVQIKQGAREVSYRISAKAGSIIQMLSPKAEVYAVKITNMRTIEREFASLESLQYYDLAAEILEAKPSPMLDHSPEAVDKVMANYHLNRGQAKAILNARDNDAFTLIQGPPGTGKTKTIVAMVGALLTGNLSTITGTVISKPGQNGSGQALSKKLLVCAPSNAAVDELVLRLKQGVKTISGSFHKINVLRLGRSDAINAAVKDVTLDELVRVQIEGDATKESGPTNRQKMHEEAGQIKQELAEVRPMLDAARVADDREQVNTLARKFEDLKRRQVAIGNRIDADKDSGNTAQRESEIRRRQVQQQILDSAHVLCSTLSGAGHEMLKTLNVEFETVIIDEAAQCVELSALIPLKYGCSKCILVGDPKQLPPTVLSQSAQRYGYDQSLFVRMQQNSPNDVHLLDMQYRMHPEISMFPSQEFYEGKLADGADMAKLRHQPWHQTGLLGPYRFFDVIGSQTKGHRGQSLVNHEELKVAMQLYERFRMDNPRVDMKGKIGIITPYKAQLFALRDRFESRYGPGIKEEIEFNTTDAFQGRECEIIIFSCVRASPSGGIGFMTDIRRMNVGLTRAKSSLWILGDSRALVQGEYWNKLIENAKSRDRYTSGNILAQLGKPGVKLPPPVFSDFEPEPMVVDEVDMKNIPMRPTSSYKKPTSQLPETYTIIERPPPVIIPASYSGINERGEPVTGKYVSPARPVIHSGGQKRPADGLPDGAHPTKRNTSAFLPGKSAPTRPRAMPHPPRPIDPSAISVMSGDQGSASHPPPNAPKGPKPNRPNPMIQSKKKADPFLQRKPRPPR
ncbi:SEN1 N terminal-domain-containing protein [Truncatella angustata]|uniref:SEN1 N terminal-domain-containing protein n=1 Tax=Truncatella angustata TaxID=152316 RepID=A0A9P8RPP2_9PEZI|nr:SEN1 N terminal-domain-containing protein [Truncatella angustata]KAH6647006.1 SEN1 N terminal-domain-containing protein [Truncatella angustata]